MLIGPEYDWSEASDSKVWHAAQNGLEAASVELRRREAKHRAANIHPEAKRLMASRLRNGRPGQ